MCFSFDYERMVWQMIKKLTVYVCLFLWIILAFLAFLDVVDMKSYWLGLGLGCYGFYAAFAYIHDWKIYSGPLKIPSPKDADEDVGLPRLIVFLMAILSVVYSFYVLFLLWRYS